MFTRIQKVFNPLCSYSAPKMDPKQLEDFLKQLLQNQANKRAACLEDNKRRDGPSVSKLMLVKQDNDDEELQNALMNKAGASFVGDNKKVSAPKKKAESMGLDFSIIDDSNDDDEVADPGQAQVIASLHSHSQNQLADPPLSPI